MAEPFPREGSGEEKEEVGASQSMAGEEKQEDAVPAGTSNRLQPVASFAGDEDSDRQQLVGSSDEEEDEELEDYAFPTRRRYGSRVEHRGTKWWFQEPAVKRNWLVVLVAWGFVLVGIACIITGIGLEIAFHSGADDIIRGFVFIIVAAIVLLPSVYVVLHVYLAAKRVGRVRFSSIWFFTK